MKEEGGLWFRGIFSFNLLTAPVYMNRNVVLVYSKIWLYSGEYFDVSNERT